MLKKLYEKSNIWFAVAWIITYCVLLSVGDSLSDVVGIQKSVTLPIGLLLSGVLLLFLKREGFFKKYGLCRGGASPGSMLFYIPILVMLSANLWHGFALNFSILETILYILAMFCVGFLEEIIFRGLLFSAMRKDNLTVAVVVSALTFGIGHIINLFNGFGADLLANLLQVVYASAAGFMFVMMFCKEKSLVTCIAAHGVFNALSAFSNEASLTNGGRITVCVLLTLITGSYAVYLAFSIKGNTDECDKVNQNN